MLTAIGEVNNSLTSPLFGADDYMDKPFDFDELDEYITASQQEVFCDIADICGSQGTQGGASQQASQLSQEDAAMDDAPASQEDAPMEDAPASQPASQEDSPPADEAPSGSQESAPPDENPDPS
mgnify:CR=1 FL=1